MRTILPGVGVGIIRQKHTKHNMPVEKDVENSSGDSLFSSPVGVFSIL